MIIMDSFNRVLKYRQMNSFTRKCWCWCSIILHWPGNLTVAPQCLRRPQRVRSEVSCWVAPGPDRAAALQWWPPWLRRCRWFERSSAGREPAGLLSAAGSGPEPGLSSAGAAGSGSAQRHTKLKVGLDLWSGERETLWLKVSVWNDLGFSLKTRNQDFALFLAVGCSFLHLWPTFPLRWLDWNAAQQHQFRVLRTH